MEIREVTRLKKCSTRNCDKRAKYSVFSEGKPNNFFQFCCKGCVIQYMDIQKRMRGAKK